MAQPKKIIIAGLPGAGKTTISKVLSETFNLPIINTDSYCFDSNWKRKKREDIIDIIETLVSGEEWIIDGMYGDIAERFLRCADLVIYIRISLFTTLMNLIRRKLRHLMHRKAHNYSNKRILMGSKTLHTTVFRRNASRNRWNDIIAEYKDSVNIITINNTKQKTCLKLIEKIKSM
jgi:adenylate kinase family enzyme